MDPSALAELWEQRQARTRPIGTLAVTSGALIACDPLEFFDCAEPFAREVPRGRFPVRVGLSASGQISVALVELGAGAPMSWESALGHGESGGEAGFPVESGVGAFLDRDAANLLIGRQQRRIAKKNELEQAGTATLEALSELERELPLDPFIRVRIPLGKGAAGALVLDRASGANVVFFTTGDGAGTYLSSWGLDQHGVAVALVTDFSGSLTPAG